MAWVRNHPRLVRGAQAVHKTQAKRLKEQEKIRQIENEEQKAQYMTEEEKIAKFSEEMQQIEATFLVPKSKNFIETEAVTRYEERVFLWLRAGYPMHLIGPTGCGKTALAIKVAEKLGRPMIWINGDEATTTTDLVGGYSKIETTTVHDRYIHKVYKGKDTIAPVWVNNPLALACKNGYTLIYNEFSRANANANNVLLGVLEEGILELPTCYGAERFIKVHPEFRLILTSNNIEYAGVHKPQDALLDRLASVHMDYYDEETETKIVDAHSKIGLEKASRIVKTVRALRAKMDGAEKPGTRPAIMIACALQQCNGNAKEMYEQICVDAIASKFNSLQNTQKKIELVRDYARKFN
jgi:gas vesicle protein GvpN